MHSGILSRVLALSVPARKMSAYQVLVTRPDVPKIAFDLFEKRGIRVTTWKEEKPMPREELLREIVGKDAVLCVVTDVIGREALDKAGPNLKVVSTMSVGYEHLDVAEMSKRKIRIGYTPGVLTDAVAELTIGLLLATSRRFFESHQCILNSTWPAWSPQWMCGSGLKNSTVGIVGFGRIGQAIAKLLQPFGITEILYYGRKEKPEGKELKARLASLDSLARNSDFIIVTCELNQQTKGLINKDVFDKMKQSAILINTSRGAVVEQQDLIDALKMNKIRAAGLDVMVPEPLPADHELLSLKNCVVIPHIGSAETVTRNNMAELSASNIIAALENREMPAELIL